MIAGCAALGLFVLAAPLPAVAAPPAADEYHLVLPDGGTDEPETKVVPEEAAPVTPVYTPPPSAPAPAVLAPVKPESKPTPKSDIPGSVNGLLGEHPDLSAAVRGAVPTVDRDGPGGGVPTSLFVLAALALALCALALRGLLRRRELHREAVGGEPLASLAGGAKGATPAR